MVETPQGKQSNPVTSAMRKEVEGICDRLLGGRPDRVALPGGKSRPVFLVEVSGRLAIIAKRDELRDAQTEAYVLEGLEATSSVPSLIGRDGNWIVQNYVKGPRLPLVLDQAKTPGDREAFIEAAFEALLKIHRVAKQNRLNRRAPSLGVVDGWLNDRIGLVDDISQRLNLKAPRLNRTAIAKIYDTADKQFIKWDARPGNAIVAEAGTIWFDWEDCGLRDPLDDLACFLADEWVSVSLPSLNSLAENFIPLFAPNRPIEKSIRYFHVAASLQCLYRLKLIVRYYQRDSGWWDREACLKGDKVGVTERETACLLNKMVHWSDSQPLLKPLSSWAFDVASILGVLLENADIVK